MMPVTRTALFFAAGALLGACGDAAGPRSEFDSNRRQWRNVRPSLYIYEFQRLCFCPTEATLPVRITVSDDAVTAVVRVSDSQPVPAADVDRYFRVTIDSLFSIIERAYDANARTVSVQYDAAQGYPTDIAIDYSAMIVDEEMAFTAGIVGPEAIRRPSF